MKITELQIVDWVLVEDTPRRVAYLSMHQVVGYHLAEGESVMHYARLCETKPIPLTPEILEKNGIKFQYGQLWYQLHNDRIQIVCGEMRLCVDYVHTLQHALRLCGLDELADNIQI